MFWRLGIVPSGRYCSSNSRLTPLSRGCSFSSRIFSAWESSSDLRLFLQVGVTHPARDCFSSSTLLPRLEFVPSHWECSSGSRSSDSMMFFRLENVPRARGNFFDKSLFLQLGFTHPARDCFSISTFLLWLFLLVQGWSFSAKLFLRLEVIQGSSSSSR